jgi:RimJ/RimL family protein N-acetyltransferase
MAEAVLLRDVTESDLPIFFEQQRDPDAAEMAAFPPRDETAFARHWAALLADERIMKKTVVFQGRVAGHIVSFRQGGEGVVGYWLGKEYWGRGIATEALSQFLQYVRERPLYAHVAKRNEASIRVLEKCGFAISGQNTTLSGEEEVEEFIMRLDAE